MWVVFFLKIKVSGPSGQMSWIRGGPTSLDASNIRQAIDDRLDVIYVTLLLFVFYIFVQCSNNSCATYIFT